MVDRGSYSAIWTLPLTNVKRHSDLWPTVASQLIRFSTNLMTLIPSLNFTELWVVSMEHLQRMWLVSRERLPFWTPSSVPFRGMHMLRLFRLFLIVHQSYELNTEFGLPRIMTDFHGAFVTDVACQQEALTLQTPGSVPLFRLDCAPIVETRFLELAVSFSTFHLE